MDTFSTSKYNGAVIVAHVATLAWWGTLLFRGVVDTLEVYLLGVPFNVVLGVSCAGLMLSLRGFGLRQHLSVIFFACGLFMWAAGSLLFIFLLVITAELPSFPSWVDLLYSFSYLFWALGLVFLARELGLRPKLGSLSKKLLFFLIPAVVIIVSYYLLVVVVQGDASILGQWSKKVALDFVFLFLDTALLLFVAFFVYFILEGSVNRKLLVPVVALQVGFLSYYLSDFLFAYSTTYNLYSVASLMDAFFGTSIVFIFVGTVVLRSRLHFR